MKSRFAPIAAVCCALLLPAAGLAGKPASPAPLAAMPKTAPGTPTAAIRQLADAYEHESVEELAAVLTADYRFHPSESESLLAQYMTGWDRERELKTLAGVAGMLDHVRTSVSRFESGPDPEHPEAPSQYRVVVAHDFSFSGVMHAQGDRVENVPADHIFYLVRGDVATLADGQSRASHRWYIRAWFENVRAAEAAFAKADGRCADVATATAGTAELAIRAVETPLCSTLGVFCDLPESSPATLEVFDLAGRRLANRTLTPGAAGTSLRVEAGSGTRFAPGAYFVRLSQGRQKPVSKLVVVAR